MACEIQCECVKVKVKVTKNKEKITVKARVKVLRFTFYAKVSVVNSHRLGSGFRCSTRLHRSMRRRASNHVAFPEKDGMGSENLQQFALVNSDDVITHTSFHPREASICMP